MTENKEKKKSIFDGIVWQIGKIDATDPFVIAMDIFTKKHHAALKKSMRIKPYNPESCTV